jgi:hypothetical protein
MNKWLVLVITMWLPIIGWAQTKADSTTYSIKPQKQVALATDSNKRKTTVSNNKTKLTALDSKKAIVAAIDSTNIKDSLTKKDSLLQLAIIDSLKADSAAKAAIAAEKNKKDTSTYSHIFNVPNLPNGIQPVYRIDKLYITANKDPLFYFFVGLLFLLGFIRVVFNKYMGNIFTVFFQTSYKQKQLRDQLLQSKLASLLLNAFFVMVVSVYICLLIGKNEWLHINFWWLLFYSAIIVASVYTIKYLFLQFTGWIFNTTDATELYTFVVFLGNKILAILLLPIAIIVAFSGGELSNIALIISYFLLGIALAYRFIISLGVIRSDLNVSGLHFFLYLCSVEVLPLLLMYKAAVNYIGISY